MRGRITVRSAFAYSSLSWPLDHHCNTNNKSNSWQIAWVNSRWSNMRPSVVTSLTSPSACIICWWKTYLDSMNNNILCLTLCCDMHFIYWPQLDFCIDFTDAACLRRFPHGFSSCHPKWSIVISVHKAKRWKGMENSHHFPHHVIPGPCFVLPRWLKALLWFQHMSDWPEKSSSSSSISICGSHARVMFPAESL